MSSSMMSSKTSSLPAPAAGYGGGDGEGGGGVDAASSALPVTSCLYLHPGAAGTLDRDAVLRRIRHRRRHNRLRDTLRSMLQAPPPREPEDMDGGAAERRQLPWPLDDAFSAP